MPALASIDVPTQALYSQAENRLSPVTKYVVASRAASDVCMYRVAAKVSVPGVSDQLE